MHIEITIKKKRVKDFSQTGKRIETYRGKQPPRVSAVNFHDLKVPWKSHDLCQND